MICLGKKKIGHASWFKLYADQHGAIFEAVTDDCAGKAVKAALRYLKTGTLPDDLQGAELVVFASLKQSADDAIADYNRKSAGGKVGNKKRWSETVSDGIGDRYSAIHSDHMVSLGIEKKEDRYLLSEDNASVPAYESGEQPQSELLYDPTIKRHYRKESP